MLVGHMETSVADIHAKADGNSQRLYAAVEVLIIQSIFVMPRGRRDLRYLVDHPCDAVVAALRLDANFGRSGPGIDRRLFTLRRANRREAERARRSETAESTVRNVVVHIALAGICLAPYILVRSDVHRFCNVSCTGIEG